jgi:hypothetical protein
MALFSFRLLHFGILHFRAAGHTGAQRCCSCATVAVMYPFLCAWTITGSIWLAKGGDCLPERANFWGVVLWLMIGYMYLIVYGIVMVSLAKAVIARVRVSIQL